MSPNDIIQQKRDAERVLKKHDSEHKELIGKLEEVVQALRQLQESAGNQIDKNKPDE